MVLLNKSRILYNKHKVRGNGMVQKAIYGYDIFQNSLKTMEKYALFELKNLWKNVLKLKAIMLGK